jgi:hypothetical protein
MAPGLSPKRVMGLEPTTFTLARCRPTAATAVNTALTDDALLDCTPDCTHNARTDKASITSDQAGGFAAALAMIAMLPLSPVEKAEAVRRLLAVARAGPASMPGAGVNFPLTGSDVEECRIGRLAAFKRAHQELNRRPPAV